ncbi:MAG: DUF4038 domain-containing protein [Candidatus Bathyarchaeia archaeon]
MAQERYALQNHAAEWSYTSTKAYTDPFNEVELDIVFTDPEGRETRVPAFWAGGPEWRIRFAARTSGAWRYRSECSDPTDAGLHDQQGILTVKPYGGSNPLLKHGPLHISKDRRYLEHEDGTPFFWLADTWWMGLCHRLSWPEEFQLLTADRVAKGFTVVQIVAGLYPDMPAFDERGANEAGFPWERGFTRVNPAYFDMADLRVQWLVRSGLVPCIVGCWGYYLPWMGVEKMKQHWRYLIARYGAYPVVWCLAGEGIMPYYLSEEKERDSAFQRKGWTELAAYVRKLDPYHHPVTIHPTDSARNQVEDVNLLDIDMLQTGHSGYASIPNTVDKLRAAVAQEPRMPALVGEVCYEGIQEGSRQEVQRFIFWACMLSGAAGHTYGANGVWQLNRAEKPFGPSPHGSSWGDTPWQEAYRLPGSAHVALGRCLLERYHWWRLEPRQEWVTPSARPGDYTQPYCAGIPGEVRIVFLPTPRGGVTLHAIEPDVMYRAYYFNPCTAREHALGVVKPDEHDDWQAPRPPIFQDWILVLERTTPKFFLRGEKTASPPH